MTLTISNGGGGGGRILYSNPTSSSSSSSSHRPGIFLPLSPRTRHVIVFAAKRLSSRTGRFDSKNLRNASITTKQDDEQRKRSAEIEDNSGKVENVGIVDDTEVDDGFVIPKLPGDEPDFWEGPQWEPLGFVVRYLWAFGIVFALIACGIAVATYNEGATDFKQTPVYKEAIGSQEILEEPEGSNSDVFESNPTEVAPSLE